MIRYSNTEYLSMDIQHHIIIYGNPADGFEYIGPFDSHEDAMRYAESDRDLAGAGDWWIVLLQAPAWDDEADGEADKESDDVRYSNAPDARGFIMPPNKPEDAAGISGMPHLTRRGILTPGRWLPGIGKSAILNEAAEFMRIADGLPALAEEEEALTRGAALLRQLAERMPDDVPRVPDKEKVRVMCHELLHLVMQYCPDMFGGGDTQPTAGLHKKETDR